MPYVYSCMWKNNFILTSIYTLTSKDNRTLPSLRAVECQSQRPYSVVSQRRFDVSGHRQRIDFTTIRLLNSLLHSRHERPCSLQKQLRMHYGSGTDGLRCTWAGQSPDGGTFLCEMTSWPPSWKYDSVNRWVFTLLTYLKIRWIIFIL